LDRQNISAAGKIGRRNFEPPPPTESDEAFRGEAVLRAEFGQKGKEPIRSDQSATMFMHVPISSKLAHFLLKNSKQIHILEKKIK
jgi:hypothetical protein